MFKLYLLFFILFLASAQTLQDKKDFWNTIHEVSHNWNEEKVLAPLGPCEGCTFLLQLYKDKIAFNIVNNNRPNTVYGCQIEFENTDQINFLGRKYEITKACPLPLGNTKVRVRRAAKAGLEWMYEISAFNLGLYIKQKQQQQYSNLLIFMCFLFNVASFILFPFSKKEAQKFQAKLYARTSIFSLIMYMQIVMIIIGYELTLLVSYVFYAQGYIAKMTSYSFIGVCFLFSAVHIGYCFAVLQRRFNELLPQSGIYKGFITVLLFFIGIVCYPVITCLFPKGLWFYFFSSAGILIQYYDSIVNKIYPYPQYLLLYLVNLLFMGGLAEFYPAGNFIELTPRDIVIFLIYEVILYVGGNFFIHKKIGVEVISGDESNFKREMETIGSTDFKSQQVMK